MTVSRDTYIAATLAAAGWDAVQPEGSAARYPMVADDDGAWDAAQRVLVSSEPYAFRKRDADEIARERERPALLIDGEMTSWYGPRAIEGMAYLATLRRRLVAAA
jgi:hypothetical protein